MIQSMTHMSVSWIELIIRAAGVYAFILLLLRLSGKRQLGQMSTTEFVALLLISNAVQNAMNAGDNSLTGGFILATVLVFLSWLGSILTFKSKWMTKILEGTPTLLIHQGKIIPKNLARELLTPADLKIILRKQGVHSFSDVATAVLESDGSLSIFKTNEKSDS
jgi:uncharacterized membrane protein YcaP (DUF421 family)